MTSRPRNDGNSRPPFDAFARSLTPERLAAIDQALGWVPEPHQTPPTDEFTYWLLAGGRGSGKTDAGAAYFDRTCRAKPIRGRIIAPTHRDARLSCVEGVSGLIAHSRSAPWGEAIRWDRHNGEVHWPNGSVALIFGAFTPEDVERLRAGGNSHLDWYEEMAAWRQLEACFDHARLGLRLGRHPKAIITTTPKPRRLFVGDPARGKRGLLQRADVVVTRASTYDNPYLSERVRAELEDMYAGTRLGRQELDAEWLRDVEGALWKAEWIDTERIIPRPDEPDMPAPPEQTRVVIGIDPATTHGPDSDETAIVCAGLGVDGEYYVWSAAGYRLSPAAWADKALDVYDEREGDLIVAERNNGGDMVEATLRQARRTAPITTIHAKRGKTLRAEPISRLYEKGLVHHVGYLPALEDQMTTFPVANEHDDMVDALVYALTELSTRGAHRWTAA